ncbi:hypothetical protein FRB96_008074 [Tulasnella sp. 330]|nr:hypothetical protein FRB96_008074 [Tulasnella sp. 330]
MPQFVPRPPNRGLPTTTTTRDQVVNVLTMPPIVAADAGKNKVDTLFGPPVGVGGNPAPDWTSSWATEHTTSEKEDELTPEVVKEWIRRSKEETSDVVPTTTLQALVNIKRPSIKLTPLSSTLTEDPTSQTHGIEFDYDADAAQCSISVHALIPSPAPPASDENPHNLTPTVLFTQTYDGGFGKSLRLDDGAILELSKLDTSNVNNSTSKDVESQHLIDNRPQTGDSSATLAHPTARPQTAATASSNTTAVSRNKRFSAFGFRRKTLHSPAAVGPSLHVVDTDAAEAAPVPAEGDDDTNSQHPVTQAAMTGKAAAEEGGVKVMIRIEALDEDGKPLASRNAQMTYLHIVQIGMTAPAITSPADEEAAIGSAPTTHWVVKVVKREALLGPHTFRLQEIYGLASSTTNANAGQTAQPEPVSPNTYPPTSPIIDTTATQGQATEHLVACRECAVNMVEFGAGGVLTHEADPTTTTAGANDTTAATAPADPTAVTAAETAAAMVTVSNIATPGPAPERRRKRKAKGWFCPVCRQPYTALLRITTTPPGKRLSEDSFSHPPVPVTVNTATTVPQVAPVGDPLQVSSSPVEALSPSEPLVSTPAVPKEAHTAESRQSASIGSANGVRGSGRPGGTPLGGLSKDEADADFAAAPTGEDAV